ncbi:MAG TPA: ComEA family DNA-binding protein, partial [Anaerolineales bacterium]|nr:ComEA family DNA-binding protein [Anaerolineales bacterium]
MKDTKQISLVLIGVLAGFILAGGLLLVSRLPSGKPVELEPAPTNPPLEVHVIGAVVRPGVYSFPEGSRVQDAVTAAGGLLTEADPNAINLAARLEDGQQLDVPYQNGAGPVSKSSGPFSVISTPSDQSSSDETTTDQVDINTATLEELETLPGIGPTLAQRIIDYRNQNGPFQQIEDIMNV